LTKPTYGGGSGGEFAGLAEFLAHEVVPDGARSGDGIGSLETREAEVSDLGAEVVVEENVAGLEIAVHDRRLALGVEKRQRASDVADDGEPLCPVQEPAVADVPEERSLEGSLRQVLEDEEQGLVGTGAGVPEEGDEPRGVSGERREHVELVRRRARLDGGERGIGERGEVDGRGGAATEEAGGVEAPGGAAERAAGVTTQRPRGRLRRGEG
jgi:hypothetical protein